LHRIRDLLRARFGAERVDVAWIGGSATWAAPVPECLPGVSPEDISYVSGVDTPWGPLGRLRLVSVEGKPLVRVPVHGWLDGEGRFQPSAEASLRVFYVLRALGVRLVLVDASVGGITLAPGDLLVASDLLDQHNKGHAYDFARRLGLVPWLRLAQPYCPQLRERLLAAARSLLAQGPEVYRPLSGRVYGEGVYVTTPFGVFETAAEIQEYRRQGGSVVGQSAGLETMLARLCGMHLGHIAIAANWAEGLDDGRWIGDMGGFYRACARPMAALGWEAVRSLMREGIALGACACETIAASTNLAGLPLPDA